MFCGLKIKLKPFLPSLFGRFTAKKGSSSTAKSTTQTLAAGGRFRQAFLARLESPASHNALFLIFPLREKLRHSRS